MKKYIPTCNCGTLDGYSTVLNNGAYVGIITQFRDNRTFIGNRAIILENNFCPQCGAPRKIIEVDKPCKAK